VVNHAQQDFSDATARHIQLLARAVFSFVDSFYPTLFRRDKKEERYRVFTSFITFNNTIIV
jgi:hypothetical protein